MPSAVRSLTASAASASSFVNRNNRDMCAGSYLFFAVVSASRSRVLGVTDGVRSSTSLMMAISPSSWLFVAVREGRGLYDAVRGRLSIAVAGRLSVVVAGRLSVVVASRLSIVVAGRLSVVVAGRLSVVV